MESSPKYVFYGIDDAPGTGFSQATGSVVGFCRPAPASNQNIENNPMQRNKGRWGGCSTRKNILTRRANHWQDSTIAKLLGRSTPTATRAVWCDAMIHAQK
jgi:hypothetical protein